jgi:hypothetical protein
MPKFQVDTLSGTFLFDARDADQARRLGQDGGRIVVKIEQLDDDEESAAPIESDFGDEEIVVIRRSDFDRLLGFARAGGFDGVIPTGDDPEHFTPGEPVDVTEDDTPGIVAPDATTVTRPSFEPVSGSQTRDDLNTIAEAEGVENPGDLANKGEVIDAINENREDADDGDATPAE